MGYYARGVNDGMLRAIDGIDEMHEAWVNGKLEAFDGIGGYMRIYDHPGCLGKGRRPYAFGGGVLEQEFRLYEATPDNMLALAKTGGFVKVFGGKLLPATYAVCESNGRVGKVVKITQARGARNTLSGKPRGLIEVIVESETASTRYVKRGTEGTLGGDAHIEVSVRAK